MNKEIQFEQKNYITTSTKIKWILFTKKTMLHIYLLMSIKTLAKYA